MRTNRSRQQMRNIAVLEPLAWEANRLHLSQSPSRVDDGSVPDALIRTLVAARLTFQIMSSSYKKIKCYLRQLCQPEDSPELRPPNHDSTIDNYYEAVDLVLPWSCTLLNRRRANTVRSLGHITRRSVIRPSPRFHALPIPMSPSSL